VNMPGFTAEESIYKTSRHYRSGAFKQADVAIHPALQEETAEPVGWQLCVDRCTMKCIKGKACNQMAPAAKATCKLDCEEKCMSDCTGLGGYGTPTELTCGAFSKRWISCNFGIPAWEAGCWASVFGGPWCKVAADEMKDQTHCEVC
jgi:hypothetical protein